MRFLRISLNILIVLVPLTVLMVGGCLLVRRIFDYLNSGARLAGTMSAEASRALKRTVRIGDVHITGNLWSLSSPNRIELTRVSVGEQAGGPPGLLVQADRAVVWYNIRQLALTKDPQIPRLDAIEVDRPTAEIVRDPAGRWNFQGLLKPQQGPGRPLTDKITVRNATLLYQDARFPHLKATPDLPLVTRARNVTAVARIRADRSVAFDGGGDAIDGVLGSFHITGIVDISVPDLTARVTANNVSMPVLGARLLPARMGKVTAGMANLDVGVEYRLSHTDPVFPLHLGSLTVHGQVSVSQLGFFRSSLGGPVDQVAGTFSVTPDSVEGNMSGRYLGATVAFGGDLLGLVELVSDGTPIPRYSLGHPAVSFHGAGQGVDIARLIRIPLIQSYFKRLPRERREAVREIHGRGSFDFQTAGTFANPVAVVNARLDRLSFRQASIDAMDAHLMVSGRALHADIEGRVAQGQVSLKGRYMADATGAYQLEAHGRALQVAGLTPVARAFGVPVRAALGGAGDVDAVAIGDRHHTPNISAQVRVAGLSVNHQTLDSVYARADTADHTLVLRTLRAEDSKGFALADGTYDFKSRKLDIHIGADEVDLGALVRASGISLPPKSVAGANGPPPSEPLPLGGIGYVRGVLGGSLDRPVFEGRLSAYAVQAGAVNVDKVIADMSVSQDRLDIRQATAFRYPGRIQVSGTADNPFKPNPVLDLTANVDEVDLSDAMHLAGVDTGKLVVGGTLSTEPIRITGTLSSLRSPRPFRARLDHGSVNALPLDNVVAEVQYVDGGIDIPSASVEVAGGVITASGTVKSDGGFSADVHGSRLNLDALTDAAPPDASFDWAGRIGGELAFHAAAKGTLKSPDLSMEVTAQNLTYEAEHLGNLQATVRLADRLATVDNLALDETGDPAAPGSQILSSRITYNLDSGAISGNGEYRGFTLARIKDLVVNSPLVRSASGPGVVELLDRVVAANGSAITGTFTVSGDLKQPEASVTWDAHNFAVDNYPIADLIGSAFVTRDHVAIPSPSTPNRWLHIVSQDATIDANHINVVFDGDVAGDISAYNVNLEALRNWLPANTSVQGNSDSVQARVAHLAAQISGQGDFFVTASGKTKSPVLDVSVNLRDVGILGQTIDRIDMDHATIAEPAIQIGTIRVVKTDTVGGKAVTYIGAVGGSIGFTWEAPFIPDDAKLDLSADIPDQPLQALSLFVPGIVGESDGKLSLTAHVTGTRSKPSVAGSATIQASRLQVAGFATGLKDVVGTLGFQGDRLVVRPGFHAQTQVYSKGVAVANKAGTPFTLEGSLPLGFFGGGDAQGIRIAPAPGQSGPVLVPFDETPLPAVKSGSLRGVGRVDLLQVAGSLKEPLLRASVTVYNTQLKAPNNFGGLATGQTALPINPKFDVTLRLGSNVRVVNSQLNAGAIGGITLGGTLASPQLNGTITIADGRLTLPNARFRLIPPGTVTVTYPDYSGAIGGVPELGLRVDLKAQTSLTATSVGGVRKRYTVTATVRGSLNGAPTDAATGNKRLALSFETDPPDLAAGQAALTEKLASSIVGVSTFDQFREPSQAFLSVLNNALANTVIPGLFDKPAEALGFEELTVNYDPLQRLTLSLSRRLVGPLYVSYFRTFADREVYDLKFSFRFSPRYQLSYDYDEEYTEKVLLEGVWNF